MERGRTRRASAPVGPVGPRTRPAGTAAARSRSPVRRLPGAAAGRRSGGGEPLGALADFRLPHHREELRAALVEAWERSAGERVEIACRGGTGRTGTALACLAVLDGLAADEAITFVRERYRRRAVEPRGQRRFIIWFAPG